MPRPSFFLVGALKSGTSAMSDYLAQHPEIFMGMKDVCYFGRDQGFRHTFQRSSDWFMPSEADYLRLFDEAHAGQMVGEACAYYLASETAAQEIADFAPGPETKILIMLRKPVEMIHSMHDHWVYGLNEDQPNFDRALALQNKRQAGVAIPKDAFWPGGLQYEAVPKYAEQVKRFFDVFGRERVHILRFEDFRGDVPGSYRETLRFLGVDPDFAADFEVVNPSKQARSQRLQKFFVNPPPLVAALAKPILSNLKLRSVIAAGVRRLNTQARKRQPMSAETKARLQAHFAPEVDALEELLGESLDSWRN